MFNNQIYGQRFQPPFQQFPQYQQYQPQQYQPQVIGIQGKTVDSPEVVKAMDVPLDRKCKLFSNS